MRYSYSLLALGAALLCAASVAVPAASTAGSAPFADPAPVVELASILAPYHSASQIDSDGSHWFIVTATNQSVRPAARILVADEPADAVLRLFPARSRPAIRQIATSDPDAVVTPAQAYGRHAFRVVLPAAGSVSLALRLSDADAQPGVTAWNEAALAAHNRQLAVFFAAVAGLIASTLAIMVGLAVMTGHPAPRWGALTLFGVFVCRLASSGLFDSIGSANIGGPYALSATLAGLTLAAGIGLADAIAPFENIRQDGAAWRSRLSIAVVALSLLSFIGVPGAMVTTEGVVVLGAAAIAVYLVNCGRLGAQAARVASPGAVVFALVTAAGAIAGLGGLGLNPAAPGVIGGFASAGAILLALAISAGEGIAILPARRLPASFAPERKTATLASGTNFLSEAVLAACQGAFELGIESGRVRLSPDAAGLIGERRKETICEIQDWIARIHADDRDVFCRAIEDYRSEPGRAFRIEFRLAGPSLPSPWLELRATILSDRKKTMKCVGLLADITVRKQGETRRVPGDKLLELTNRESLITNLKQAGSSVSGVGIADIDRFKAIHASLGDEGGDRVLREFAGRLCEKFGSVAYIYRTGGDSFGLLLSSRADEGTLESGLKDILREPVRIGGRDVYLSASMGIARASESESAEVLLSNANLALAEAKRQGGSCLRVYGSFRNSPKPDPVSLEAQLRRAIAANELRVGFQPIVRFGDGAIAGFEALLRWNHPERGMLEPSDFIAHAEETGSILEIGRWVLAQTAMALAKWQKLFLFDPPLMASVNVSRRQLQDAEFESLLGRLLGQGDIAARSLALELTESSIGSIGDIAACLDRFKSAGAVIALDDFGTGLSALSQLQRLRFDILKVDRSFVPRDDDPHRQRDSSIYRSIVQMAHDLKLAVVAEGIETLRDAAWVKEIGCDFGQGYFFGATLDPKDVPAFLERHCARTDEMRDAAEQSGVARVGRKPGDVDPQLA